MATNTLPELVVAELNAQTFSVGFTSNYRIFPINNVKDLESLKVSVYDGPMRSEVADRVDWEHREIVFVVIQEKLDVATTDGTVRAKELRCLLREIEKHFEGLARDEEALDGKYRFVEFDESTARLPFSLEEMRVASVYSAVVGLRFLWYSED